MPVISITPPTSNIPGVYAQIIAAPKSVGLIPSDIVAMVFEASRGPVNTPLYFESMNDFRQTFGPITLNPTTPTEVLNGYIAASVVGGQGVTRKYGVRVGSSALSTAFSTVQSTTNNSFTLHAASPGTWANGNLQYTIAAGATASLFNLTIRNLATNEADLLVGIPWADTNALQRAINGNATLVNATAPVIQAPITAPTGVASAGGTMTVGTYYAIVTYITATGETIGSPESAVLTTTGPNATLTVTAPALPTGATGINVYLTAANGAQGTETFAGTSNTNSLAISAPPTVSTVVPPVANTAYATAYVAAAPTAGTFTFLASTAAPTALAAPGNDGANAPTSAYVGVSGTPSTGIYSLSGVVPHANFALLAGTASTDTTQWAALAQWGADNDCQVVAGLPKGTSVTAASTTMAGATVTAIGASYTGDFPKVAYPWVDIYEGEIFKANYRIPSTYHYAGVSAVQAANTSAENKPLYNLVAPEYTITRTQAETLIPLNLNVVRPTVARSSNGLPSWGFTTDRLLSARNAFEVRMQALILEDFEAIAINYVGKPNTPILRSKAQSTFSGRLDFYAEAGLIPANPAGASVGTVATPLPATVRTTKVGVTPLLSTSASSGTARNYLVVCDDSNNLVNGIATNNLIVDVQVLLFPNIDKVIFRAEIGANVQVNLLNKTQA